MKIIKISEEQLVNQSFESYKNQVLAKANGANIHKLNNMLGGVLMMLENCALGLMSTDKLEKQILEIAKLTKVHCNAQQMIEEEKIIILGKQ